MSFFKFLQGIGGRLGVLEAVACPETKTEIRIQTRMVTLKELECEIESQAVCMLAKSPEELSMPFESIFKTAGVSSKPEDWTIERLRQMIASEPLAGKPREELQEILLRQLLAEGVLIENIIKDAVARDHALDSFEACMSGKMNDLRDWCNDQLAEIEKHIQDLQQKRQQLEDQMAKDEQAWKEWRKRKHECERGMASAASYIVDRPVITTDDEH
jgi:hypothetical protein